MMTADQHPSLPREVLEKIGHWIYFVAQRNEDGSVRPYLKVGRTSGALAQRLSSHSVANPFGVVAVYAREAQVPMAPMEVETWIKRFVKKAGLATGGEWFRVFTLRVEGIDDAGEVRETRVVEDVAEICEWLVDHAIEHLRCGRSAYDIKDLSGLSAGERKGAALREMQWLREMARLKQYR